jgi:hypothetical protein
VVFLIVAIAIDLCAFASAVVIAVDPNSHEEKVRKICDSFVYMDNQLYAKFSIKWVFPIERSHSGSVIVLLIL